jgi:hypothetical protein
MMPAIPVFVNRHLLLLLLLLPFGLLLLLLSCSTTTPSTLWAGLWWHMW